MGRSHKEKPKDLGCKSKDIKPRAWVIRVPAQFIAVDYMNAGGYQTVVLAKDSDAAWDVAADTDTWEVLEFKVTTMAIFPKDPISLK